MTSATPREQTAASHTFERQLIGPISHLRIRGAIDETFNAKKFADAMVGHVLIDLGGITRISSFGVRQWMELTQRLPLGALGMSLLHVPPVLVDQLNMVEGFAGIGRVLSLLAPYACERCCDEKVRVIDLMASGPEIAAGDVPQFNCTACGGPMRFAELAPEYLSFVTQHPVQAIEPVVAKYLNALKAPRVGDQSGYVKIVENDLTYLCMASTLKAGLSVRKLSSGFEGTVVYDFSWVAVVEPAAGEKLLAVLAAAATSARVILWKVPPVVLSTLAAAPSPPSVSLATLWLPCECSGCGSSHFQSIEAGAYLEASRSGGQLSRRCGVCQAEAKVPLLEGVARLLTACPVGEVPAAQLEGLEQRALSQLVQGGAPEHTPSTHTPSGMASTRPGPVKAKPEASREPSQSLHLLKAVGRGGMAEVFLARQVGLNGFEKYVTVKRILPQFAQSPDFVEMLFAEARANARLTHPNVVQIFDVGAIDGVAHITMEYVRGPDFKRILILARKSGALVPVPHALRVVAETAAGLHYAHTFVDPLGNPHPVVHRDVSPHNILVSLDGAVKLSDFGIAKVNDGGEGTRPGVFKGKLQYSSPEQLRGVPLDARHDVFGLGIVLFEALTGFLPFKAENDAATMAAVVRLATPDPRQAIPGLPDDVCAVVLKALEKDPDDRFQSAAEFAETIEHVMSRHGYRSSPLDVANYVKGLLGDLLKDFSPTGAAEPSRPVRLGTLSGTKNPSPSSPSISGVRRPASSASLPMLSPPPPPGPPTKTGVAVPHPMPRPSQPTLPRPSQPTLPRPSQPPPAPSRPPPLAPPAASAAPRLSDPVAKAPVAGGRKRLPRIAIGAAICLGVAGLGLVKLLGGDPRVEVTNLRRGEVLYVGGVRVDPLALSPVPGGKPLVIAVALDGVLTRMGTAAVERELDLQPLFDAEPGQEQTATLVVTSQPSGCPVEVAGKKTASPTPVTATIAAGKQLQVEIRCPGGEAWSREILGVPGQSIELTVAAAMQ